MRRRRFHALPAAGLALACAGWVADVVAQGTWGTGPGASRTTSSGTSSSGATSSGAWTSSAVRPPAPPRESYQYPLPTRIIAAPRVVYVAPPAVAYAPPAATYVPAPSHAPPAYVPPPPAPPAVAPPAASTWRTVAGPYLAVDGGSFVAGGITYVLSGLSVHDVASPQGAAARARLQDLLNAGSVSVWRIAVDGYGRSIARVVVNGADLSIKLRQEGFARA